MSRVCFFIGHREAPSTINKELFRAVNEAVVVLGVTEFVVGHYGSFDGLAAAAVRRVKELHPHISLRLLLPYHPSARPIEIPEGFDGTYYPPGQEFVPYRLAIARANRHMVQECDILIAYVKHPGNARNILEYAERRSIPIINLA